LRIGITDLKSRCGHFIGKKKYLKEEPRNQGIEFFEELGRRIDMSGQSEDTLPTSLLNLYSSEEYTQNTDPTEIIQDLKWFARKIQNSIDGYDKCKQWYYTLNMMTYFSTGVLGAIIKVFTTDYVKESLGNSVNYGILTTSCMSVFLLFIKSTELKKLEEAYNSAVRNMKGLHNEVIKESNTLARKSELTTREQAETFKKVKEFKNQYAEYRERYPNIPNIYKPIIINK